MPRPPQCQPLTLNIKLFTQISKVMELIEINVVITPYGRSGN